MARRRPTSTSSFGASRRESHDASGFYARFTPPALSDDSEVDDRKKLDDLFHGDARAMPEVHDKSVALVVTSPPYFAGKEYEEALGEGHVPATYLDYLRMLEEVFAECTRTLEPGGRIAVNVANLGRKPYRSLSADVIDILQNRLRLLLRGEVIWLKAHGASGSCAWGSFQSPANPVLRDLTERVIIASKGRFDRAVSARARHAEGLPSAASLFRDEFVEATTDVWDIPPESATRVGHPAPFPVELPERLIHLYTFLDDLVLDPFMGSGTTAVAAVRTNRHFVGYDTDEGYVERARGRVARERQRLDRARARSIEPLRAVLPAMPQPEARDGDRPARAVREGRKAKDLAQLVLEECGFTSVVADRKLPEGVDVDFEARDRVGRRWLFDVSGAFTSTRTGLRRADQLWHALGKALVFHASQPDARVVLLTTDAPATGSAGGRALDRVRPEVVHDVVEFLQPEGRERLREYAAGRDRPRAHPRS